MAPLAAVVIDFSSLLSLSSLVAVVGFGLCLGRLGAGGEVPPVLFLAESSSSSGVSNSSGNKSKMKRMICGRIKKEGTLRQGRCRGEVVLRKT